MLQTVRQNEKVAGHTAHTLQYTKNMWVTECSNKSDELQFVIILCANEVAIS